MEQNHIWDKFDTLRARELVVSNNSGENYKKHIERNQGKVMFRFPPEPNGYLHIGHAKVLDY